MFKLHRRRSTLVSSVAVFVLFEALVGPAAAMAPPACEATSSGAFTPGAVGPASRQ